MTRMHHSVILVLAIVTGLVAFILTMSVVKPPKIVSMGSMPSLVVTATSDIQVGSVIRNSDVDLLSAPGNVNPKVLFTDFESVTGKLSRRMIRKGEAIRTVDLYEEGESLSSLIPPGYRAMSIPVTTSSTMAKLVNPGNRVDVLLTYKAGMDDYTTITLVKNAKVIDVAKPSETGSDVRLSITLAVTPEGAKTLAYAMEKGDLKISVYSLEDSEKDQEEKFFTLKELFFREGETGYQQIIPTSEGVETIRGLRKEKQTFNNS
jgi:pilus assembly protein CpaB